METHVLVVDDNPDSGIIISRILRPHGYRVTVAQTGGQALDCVKQEPPDVVLLDVMMPEMSGLEVLQRLKDEYGTGNIPVILVTARTQDDDVVTGYQYGADYYITKPFTAKQLLYGLNLVLSKEDGAA